MIEPAQFAHRLLAWFDVSGRAPLPWTTERTPYRVWISEIMLQQTQVNAVIPYYLRFMRELPDVRALARAELDTVLHLWTGLGYYARARNLLACARVLIDAHGGEFPESLDEVMKLPGIGRSTAGAILALARDRRHCILDGNAKRVLSRVFGIDGVPGLASTERRLWELADACTPSTRIADYTQAIMDHGATVCTRARPACTVCPMIDVCVAARSGRQRELPLPKPRRARGTRQATLIIADRNADGMRSVLLERRPARGIWGGLWSPPQFESRAHALDWCRRELHGLRGEPQNLDPIDHAFTHFDLRLYPIRVACAAAASLSGHAAVCEQRQWYSFDSPPRLGLPQPIRVLLDQLHAGGTS